MKLNILALRKKYDLDRLQLLKKIEPHLSYVIDEDMLKQLEDGDELEAQERMADIRQALEKEFPQEVKGDLIERNKIYLRIRRMWPVFTYTIFMVVVIIGAYFLWEADGILAGIYIAILGLAISSLDKFSFKN